FERWRPPPGISVPWLPEDASSVAVETFTILTTDANPVVAEVHDRMPVIVPPDAFDRWLGGGEVPFGPYPPEAMTAFRVSPVVNSPMNDDPSCVQPLAGGDARGTGGRSPPSLFG
ncbi:MAG: SOS response-associated peptidase family protein, partial [Acidobacteriota bacterium]|nr:SOS response-associated peptidase family protein [Acidobacteriota bacterium]